MNRKKAVAEHRKAIQREHPFDDPLNWMKGDFTTPPWSQEKIAAFQKRIDSAFGAENAIVLVWGGDRTYGDEFYDGPWDSFGNPLGKPNKKPVVLFGEYPVNETDVLYISCPRWCLMEVHHGSQLEESWEESSWIADEAFIGGRKRVRTKKPPEFYYVHLSNGVLANHEQPLVTGDIPPCCKRMWDNDKRICYGNYREPDDRDIAMIGEMRRRMDRDGFAQRNDTKRDAKAVMNANLATKYFMRHSAMQKANAAKELMLSDVGGFMGDILQRKGSTMSLPEMERIVKNALEADDDTRFSKEII